MVSGEAVPWNCWWGFWARTYTDGRGVSSGRRRTQTEGACLLGEDIHRQKGRVQCWAFVNTAMYEECWLLGYDDAVRFS
jgi:hypothetical protein